ncbi:uncharacterized protein (TIGR02569 family) [Thermocatellispora tengchongensis]|uniref:Uncharacterized protein (TIGR02569 family) n=2 Tax=Thermocatellispora tengchongensis TaxID=1073253 RepID=A0A840PL39_9ACTN|nr:hypothetical protein [Thermocatellispora tengchongensis]MBB5136765.1 uncharacterized protein (TIGR02569 family) [Thermocatellispora tengchongensis]
MSRSRHRVAAARRRIMPVVMEWAREQSWFPEGLIWLLYPLYGTELILGSALLWLARRRPRRRAGEKPTRYELALLVHGIGTAMDHLLHELIRSEKITRTPGGRFRALTTEADDPVERAALALIGLRPEGIPPGTAKARRAPSAQARAGGQEPLGTRRALVARPGQDGRDRPGAARDRRARHRDAQLPRRGGGVDHGAMLAGHRRADVFAGLTSSTAFRVPRPYSADDGTHVVAGWTAFEFVDGQEGPAGEWATLIAASRAFHRALRHLPRPGLLDRRQHPWAVADRIAWGEIGTVTAAHTDGLLATLQDLQRPVNAPSQLVHGDLTGNVLLQSGRPPAVIDFSPYWRPVGYAEAIVVADGLLYHDAQPGLIDSVLPGRDGLQMLVRALIFRLATSALFEGPGRTLPQEELARFARVTRLVEERIHADRHFGTRPT